MNIVKNEIQPDFKSFRFSGNTPEHGRIVVIYKDNVTVRLETLIGYTVVSFTKEEFISLFGEVIKELTNGDEAPGS